MIPSPSSPSSKVVLAALLAAVFVVGCETENEFKSGVAIGFVIGAVWMNITAWIQYKHATAPDGKETP